MSVDLRRLGATFPIEAIALVGDDEEGRFLAGLCDQMNIDRRQMHVTSDVPTSVTHVMSVKTSGLRTFFYRAGTADVLTPDHFDFSTTQARLLHLGLPGQMKAMDDRWRGDPNGWVTVLRQARQAGLKSNIELASVESTWIGELVRPCLPWLDYLVINDHEAGGVTGIATLRNGATDVAACREAARQIVAMGSAEFVAVHFPTGCVAATRDGAVLDKPSVRVPKEEIVGSNGAGDAFAAGVLFGVHEGWPLQDCLALAHATAAASLRSITTNGSVENWRACLALAERWGWRDPLP
jgi:sugar/nucleoside kinase (ribokinase family)